MGLSMARIRTIKPEFFTSEDIVGLSPLARLLYIALWCEADREGRLVWKPKTFKMRYFPGDKCDIDALCNEILDAGLIVQYGECYAYIPTFHSHQHINPRESQTQLPTPDIDAIVTRASRVSDAQGGREGKGKEGNDKEPKGSSLASKTPSQQLLDLFHEKCTFLPTVTVFNENRRRTLQSRYREVMASEKWTAEETMEWFGTFYGIVNDSKFLTGRSTPGKNGRAFKADWDWIHGPQNFVKIVEGKYSGE